MVRQVFTLLKLEQRGEDKIRNGPAGKDAVWRSFNSGVSKVHSLFFLAAENGRIIMCWRGTRAQTGLSLHMWLNCSRMTLFILSSSQKNNTYMPKKNQKYTNDRWWTKKSRLQSLTRWIAHCAVGTFPSASGWCPCRCGCRSHWWELSLMSAETAQSGLTCTWNDKPGEIVLYMDVCFPPTWASNTASPKTKSSRNRH